MTRKTKLLLSIAILILTVVSLLDTAWANPTSQGTVPWYPFSFFPTDYVYLPMVIRDSWTPPWWVPHPMSLILRGE